VGSLRDILVLTIAITSASCGVTMVPVPIGLRVHISGAGECRVVGYEPVPCDGLGAYIKGLYAPPSCDIQVDVDRESQYEVVTTALSSMQKAGFKKIGFLENNHKSPRPQGGI
jgi:biopolymer transport protein ExbD